MLNWFMVLFRSTVSYISVYSLILLLFENLILKLKLEVLIYCLKIF